MAPDGNRLREAGGIPTAEGRVGRAFDKSLEDEHPGLLGAFAATLVRSPFARKPGDQLLEEGVRVRDEREEMRQLQRSRQAGVLRARGCAEVLTLLLCEVGADSPAVEPAVYAVAHR